MMRHKNGIFYADVIVPPEYEKETFYLFKTETSYVSDPYAKHICGRDEFGKKKQKAGFSISAPEPVKPEILKAKLCDTTVFVDDMYVKNELSELILYELHVRSFTAASEKSKYPGTFDGVSEKIPYLKRLGITGVLLMPVYDFDENMPDGKTNLWGYGCRDTYYFAPKASFAFDREDPCTEFKKLIEKLHAAHVDVYMDLMFPEGASKSMMIDTARYYAVIYGIDGFHIDDYMIDPRMMLSDPLLSNCRFWVTNTDDRLLRDFPGRCLKYNNSYMNDMRRYLKGDEGLVPMLYDRMKNRGFESGISFIANHNGFSLFDLYSYDVKHNNANGENGRDGNETNYSWNCGEEGETKNRKVKALRLKMIKNAVTALFITGGVPMLNAGDEFGFSKQGNNNTYCQDNELSYIDWTCLDKNKALFNYVKQLIDLRKSHSVLKNPKDLREIDYQGHGIPEISLHGTSPWKVDYQPYNRLAGIYLCGSYGEDTKSEDLYIIFNMHWEKHEFVLPERRGTKLHILIDTSGVKTVKINDGCVTAEPRSVIILGSGQ